jgi:hypothetical protein
MHGAGASPPNKVVLNQRNNAPFAIYTNNSQRIGISGTGTVEIASGGFLGVGVTPTHLIELNGGAYSDGTGAWVTGSDIAYKKDVRTMTKYGLAQVMELRPVTFVHKADKLGKTQLGFIAQEVKPVIPEIVDGEEGRLGLAYDRLTPVLVKAIQEQQAQIKAQQRQIEQLQTKLNKLESKLSTSRQ